MKSILLLFGIFFSASLPDGHAAAKPNIILVMPDDVGYGDYACLGNPIMRTPAVDAFRKQSLLFTQFHVSPTCSPTRSALMSGRHEFKNGVTHTILERERLTLKTFTLPQMLKTAGYTSGIFGKWHLGDEEAYRPENRGFDEVYTHGAGGIGQSYPGSCGDAPGNTNINPAIWHNGKFEKTTGYCTDLFFSQAMKWMDEKRKGSQPFFAFISLNAAHSPHVLPKEYYEHYLGKPGVDEDMAKFFGMIENVDTNFGKVLQKLKEWQMEENTLVIYLGSDNGGTAGIKLFDAGMRGSKGTPYQGGTRVPCFFRWPAGGIPAGGECSALAAHLDVFPTLAEITGGTVPESAKTQVEGKSLLPVLKDPASPWPDRMLVHHVGRWPRGQAEQGKYRNMSIQNARFTLVNNKELYDLRADPREKTNVIDQHPQVAAQLRAAYEQWWMEVQPLLVNENLDGPAQNPMHVLYWKQFGGEPAVKKPSAPPQQKPRKKAKKAPESR